MTNGIPAFVALKISQELLVAANSMNIDERFTELCTPRNTFLGVFVMILIIASVCFYLAGYLIADRISKDGKLRKTLEKGAIVSIVLSALGVLVYILGPVLAALLFGPPASPC